AGRTKRWSGQANIVAALVGTPPDRHTRAGQGALAVGHIRHRRPRAHVANPRLDTPLATQTRRRACGPLCYRGRSDEGLFAFLSASACPSVRTSAASADSVVGGGRR